MIGERSGDLGNLEKEFNQAGASGKQLIEKADQYRGVGQNDINAFRDEQGADDHYNHDEEMFVHEELYCAKQEATELMELQMQREMLPPGEMNPKHHKLMGMLPQVYDQIFKNKRLRQNRLGKSIRKIASKEDAKAAKNQSWFKNMSSGATKSLGQSLLP